MTKSVGKSSTRRGNRRLSKGAAPKGAASRAATAKATPANSARTKAVVAARAAAAAAVAAAEALAEAELEGVDVSDLLDNDPDLGAGGNVDEDAAAPGKGEDYLDFLSRMFDNMGGAQKDVQKYNDMSLGVGMVLGSGPAFAALESMFASTNAQSAVLMNATQTQRQLDHVGLCCTSACVKQLLNLNTGQDSD